LWDKRVCGCQVTDLKEQTMEIRCLVSSRNSGENFDLRCIVREEMISFLRENYPEAFPRVRVFSKPGMFGGAGGEDVPDGVRALQERVGRS